MKRIPTLTALLLAPLAALSHPEGGKGLSATDRLCIALTLWVIEGTP